MYLPKNCISQGKGELGFNSEEESRDPLFGWILQAEEQTDKSANRSVGKQGMDYTVNGLINMQVEKTEALFHFPPFPPRESL